MSGGNSTGIVQSPGGPYEKRCLLFRGELNRLIDLLLAKRLDRKRLQAWAEAMNDRLVLEPVVPKGHEAGGTPQVPQASRQQLSFLTPVPVDKAGPPKYTEEEWQGLLARAEEAFVRR